MYSLHFILDSYNLPSRFFSKFLAYFEFLDLLPFDPYIYSLLFSQFLTQTFYY